MSAFKIESQMRTKPVRLHVDRTSVSPDNQGGKILLILLLLLILLFSLSYKQASFTAVLWDVTQGNLRESCATFQRTTAKESN